MQGTEKDKALALALQGWVVENCELPIARNQREIDNLIGIDLNDLLEYSEIMGTLLYRTYESYTEDDKFRTKDGGLLSDALIYPTTEFRKATYEADNGKLFERKLRIDDAAAAINTSYRRFSLANTAAQAFSFVYGFDCEAYLGETIAVEYDLETEEIEWDLETHWNGAIDWVFRTKEGALVIADHKSDKEKPSQLDVLWHSQLNLYAALYLEITGELADYIAINHLRSGQLVPVPVDIKVVDENFQYWKSVQKSIQLAKENDSFTKQLPTKFNSPCIRRDWKTKQVTQVCPFIGNCWPDYAKEVKFELVSLLPVEVLQNI